MAFIIAVGEGTERKTYNSQSKLCTILCFFYYYLPMLSAGGGAKLSGGPGWFASPHWLHHRNRQLDERGNGVSHRRVVMPVVRLVVGWRASCLGSFIERGSVLHCWNAQRERADALRVQHRHRQLPQGGHHSKLWLGRRGQVWHSSRTLVPLLEF